jgi:predicted LPLAT superfamily acyltransferase
VALQATQSDRISVKKGDRIQQLQQQIEAWQALLEKLGGNE